MQPARAFTARPLLGLLRFSRRGAMISGNFELGGRSGLRYLIHRYEPPPESGDQEKRGDLRRRGITAPPENAAPIGRFGGAALTGNSDLCG